MSDPVRPSTQHSDDFLIGGGEMGKAVRAKDWSKTPLGPIESWPQSLRTAVSLALASNFPINIIWGPQRNQIYNDGYRPLCGAKHPHSMGQDYKECWLSAWPVIGGAFERASGGEAAFLVNQRMFLDRNGYLEETFFTFSHSPIRDESGAVAGLFHPVTELTQQSLTERRLTILRDLADNTTQAKSVEDAARLIAETLKRSELDMPFALLYLLESDGKRARLAQHVGLAPGAGPQLVDLEMSPPLWPLSEAARSRQIIQVDNLEQRFGVPACGPYPETPRSALVMPICLPALEHPLAVLIAGVSPRRELDAPYRWFYDMLAEAVTSALSKARAYEEERRQAEALAEIDRAKAAFFSNVSHESERRLRDFADTAPAMLWVTEADGSCSFLSRGWYEYTGQTEEEGLGFGWLKAVHADDREESSRIFLEANRRHEPFILDYRLRRADGEYRWCMDAGRPRFEERGIFQGYVGSVIDITERKQAEEALRASEERLRTFAGQLEIVVEERTQELVQSHDRLRALATELNLAEQRERKRIATELHDHLQQILVLGKIKLGQGKRLAEAAPVAAKLMKETDDVLSDALTYTRTLVAELSPPVLRDHGLTVGLKWLGEYMQKHQIAVTVTVPEEDELTLPEDQTILLFQSVRELLINSSKHAGTGQATVVLEHRDGLLRIEVRDEGTGFDLAAAETPHGGISSKFGLFSIRERMRALGGAFNLHSASGQGTTATLTLPLPLRSSASAQCRVLSRPEQRHMFGPNTQHSGLQQNAKIRVLLVDDHAMVRQGLRSVLDGYEDIRVIGEAGNGEEAVQLVNQLRPTAVVMDINMPKMDGIEATGRIKSRYPETIVIGISVNAAKEKEEAMKQAGAVHLMTKEAAVEQLYDVIVEAAKQKGTAA